MAKFARAKAATSDEAPVSSTRERSALERMRDEAEADGNEYLVGLVSEALKGQAEAVATCERILAAVERIAQARGEHESVTAICRRWSGPPKPE